MILNDALDNIKVLLAARTTCADPAADPPGEDVHVPLDDFCLAKWGKSVSVSRVFRQRTEIALAELPIILMTTPEVNPVRYMDFVREYEYTARLYAGFYQPSREKAQGELLEFEQLIDDALLYYRKTGKFPYCVIDINPGAAVNDEGRHAPVYFLVKDLRVDMRRDITG
jgi:hypothetical protein